MKRQPYGDGSMVFARCPTVPNPCRGTLGQNPISRDNAWDSSGTADLKSLARKVLSRDSEWDKSGTRAADVVPSSRDAWDKPDGLIASVPPAYAAAFTALWLEDCPAYVEPEDWRLARYDANAFIQTWGEQTERLGWTAADLFGLAPVPANPAPYYRRLSRYDQLGLVWLLRGRPVLALTEDRAIIKGAAGNLTYRKAAE